MAYFNWCKTAYEKKYATEEQLRVWVSGGKITAEEYEQITGEVYNK